MSVIFEIYLEKGIREKPNNQVVGGKYRLVNLASVRRPNLREEQKKGCVSEGG